MTARHVRVTLEGTVVHATHTSDVLILTRQDGGKVCLPASGPGITWEDTVPPRTWTDGDVVQSPTHVYQRAGGQWWGIAGDPTNSRAAIGGPNDDEDTTREVARGFLTVLRYQAGEQ